MVQPAQFLGPLQGYQPTLPAPARCTLRVPPQPRALALASNLRSSLAVYFLDYGRLLAADGPSTSPYAANALLPMSVKDFNRSINCFGLNCEQRSLLPYLFFFCSLSVILWRFLADARRSWHGE